MDNQDMIWRLKTPVFRTLTEKCDFVRDDYYWLVQGYFNFTNFWVNEYAHSECEKYVKESTIQHHLCKYVKRGLGKKCDLSVLTDYHYEILFNPVYLDLDTIHIIHEMKEFVKNS